MLNIIFILLSIIYLSITDEECKRNFSIRKNAIILTKSSQAKGATFIHKQVVSKFPECYALCCSNPDCTVSVYENKVNHICFLFNCKQPNVCSFTEHSHYISMMYIKSENKPNKYDKPKLDFSRPSVDGKLGELCGSLRKCGPENSMCTSGTCICQLGFIARNGECVRSICPKPELMFQCYDVSKMPFCIALYDQCNGLLECGDGSDEQSCDERPSGRSILPNTTTNVQTRVKAERKMASQNSDINSDPSTKSAKEQTDHDDHQLSENINISHAPSRFHNSVNKSPGSRRTNPLVENQLLVLESKNSLPKYSHLNQQRPKVHRQYPKPQRDSDSNANQAYENRRYRKLKASSYPHVTKIDDYYQKSVPESSDSNSRWNNLDSYYSDYDYPQLNVNNRDQNSDWEPDKSSSIYSDSSYPDSSGKYTDSDYLDSDDDVYSKPRGRYISDNDYYNANRYSHKAFEPAMNHGNPRFQNQEKMHRIFIKPKAVQVQNTATSAPKPEVKIDVDNVNMDNINTQEWSTAVIMLSLGLLITAALLIAIGLKMRSWRRKLRKGKKGKSLTTDEGDYLINGMYL